MFLFVIAAGCWLAAMLCRMQRQRRIMLRRNIAGVEQYRSYSSFIANRCLNSAPHHLAGILLAAGLVFAAAGVFPPVAALLGEALHVLFRP